MCLPSRHIPDRVKGLPQGPDKLTYLALVTMATALVCRSDNMCSSQDAMGSKRAKAIRSCETLSFSEFLCPKTLQDRQSKGKGRYKERTFCEALWGNLSCGQARNLEDLQYIVLLRNHGGMFASTSASAWLAWF